jgi:hypothetical protein
MARSKKTKPIPVKEPRKPMDPETRERLRRFGVRALVVVFVVGACATGFVFARRYVDRRIAFPTAPPKIVLANRPVWMSDLLADEIAKTARPVGVHSAFDHQVLQDCVAVLRANPWVRTVRQVRRVYGEKPGDTLEIDCDFRAPVALVKWGDYYWLVDRDGVKLPEQFTAQQVPRIVIGTDRKMNIRLIEGVAQPPPESGRKWAGPDLMAGIEMVNLLFGRPFCEEIVKVDVSNFGGRTDAKEAQLVLVTKYASEIRWGRPLNAKDFFIEVSSAQKLAYLETVWRERKRVDGGHPWIDVRFDAITYPSPGHTAHADGGR